MKKLFYLGAMSITIAPVCFMVSCGQSHSRAFQTKNTKAIDNDLNDIMVAFINDKAWKHSLLDHEEATQLKQNTNATIDAFTLKVSLPNALKKDSVDFKWMIKEIKTNSFIINLKLTKGIDTINNDFEISLRQKHESTQSDLNTLSMNNMPHLSGFTARRLADVLNKQKQHLTDRMLGITDNYVVPSDCHIEYEYKQSNVYTTGTLPLTMNILGPNGISRHIQVNISPSQPTSLAAIANKYKDIDLNKDVVQVKSLFNSHVSSEIFTRTELLALLNLPWSALPALDNGLHEAFTISPRTSAYNYEKELTVSLTLTKDNVNSLDLTDNQTSFKIKVKSYDYSHDLANIQTNVNSHKTKPTYNVGDHLSLTQVKALGDNANAIIGDINENVNISAIVTKVDANSLSIKLTLEHRHDKTQVVKDITINF